MLRTGASVDEFLDKVEPAGRRKDALALVELMRSVTGVEPEMWGSIVGFGSYHYKDDSGREADAPAAGFAPRKGAMTIYLGGDLAAHEASLARLGPHTTGTGCLYVKNLDAVDKDVLSGIVGDTFKRLMSK